jgi:hypothetical protein
MTISSKRLPKPETGVGIKSPLQAKRTTFAKAFLRESTMTHLDILDEAMNLLNPLSLGDNFDSTTSSTLDEGIDSREEQRASPIQPSDRRRRMLRRGSKCPQMFFREIDSNKSWRRSIPISLSMSSRILQSTYRGDDSEHRESDSGTSVLHELHVKSIAQPSFLQATQEGARAA